MMSANIWSCEIGGAVLRSDWDNSLSVAGIPDIHLRSKRLHHVPTTTTTMPLHTDPPNEASQVSNSSSHIASTHAVADFQSVNISESSQPINRPTRRATSTNARNTYRTPGPIPASGLRRRECPLSTASNPTVKGESQANLDADAFKSQHNPLLFPATTTSTTTTPFTMVPTQHTGTCPSAQHLNPVVQPNGLFNLIMFRHLNAEFNDALGSLFKTHNQAHLEEFRSYLLDAIDVIHRQATSNNISITHQCAKSCISSASATNKAVRDVEVMVRPPSPTSTPRLYAEVACPVSPESTDKLSASAPRSQPPKTIRHDLCHAPPHTRTHSSKGSRPTTSLGKPMRKPVRVVIDFRGCPSEGFFDTPLALRFRQLNEFSLSRRTIPRPLGLHCNKRGNLLVSFPDDTPLDKLRLCLEDIKRCLGVAKTFKAYLDVWAKVHIANVPARDSPGSPVYSEKALDETLRLNPAIKDLHIVTPPKWIRPPDKITGTRTSAVLVFEDPDGSIARQLIKAPIFAFGSPITVKRWLATPPVKAPEQPASGTAMDTE
ncbi:hypothetical protein RSAG8_13723, partial [Rhizoctonia solani AG-8 WAC10335]